MSLLALEHVLTWKELLGAGAFVHLLCRGAPFGCVIWITPSTSRWSKNLLQLLGAAVLRDSVGTVSSGTCSGCALT